jgi:hypothetical protein
LKTFFKNRVTFLPLSVLIGVRNEEKRTQKSQKVLIQNLKKSYQMKTFAENPNNIAILTEVEMSKIFGGDGQIYNSVKTEDEEVWL